ETPVVYDYGSAVVYQDDQVYYNGTPVATAEEYTNQAAYLITVGQEAKTADTQEGQSLGVFAVLPGEEEEAKHIFQIAHNKDRVLRGNYYNVLTNTTLPLVGSVDKKNQRAAWVVGDKKDTVYETGLGNLSQAETSMLVHFGKERTQQWTLVRLEPPEESK